MSSNVSDNSQGDTGTRDVTYNLLSSAYHALQGAETLTLYIADARQEGNEELARFFQETKDQYTRIADRAKEMLGSHLNQGQGRAASGA